MEELIVIALIACGVMYYLYITFKDYLGSEENQKRFLWRDSIKVEQQIEPTFEDKIRASEYGTLTGILGYVANADGEICSLEKEVAKSMFAEMAQGMKRMGGVEDVQRELEAIFFDSQASIEELTNRFCDLTKGEYHKKLKVVEFCFVLGYADGALNDATKEAIMDVAGLFGIENQDFNRLYDDFAEENQIQITEEEAREIFGENGDLDARYRELIAQAKQSFIGDDPFEGKSQLQRLRKIHKAYEILKSQSSVNFQFKKSFDE